jgi:hypothetical protein
LAGSMMLVQLLSGIIGGLLLLRSSKGFFSKRQSRGAACHIVENFLHVLFSITNIKMETSNVARSRKVS